MYSVAIVVFVIIWASLWFFNSIRNNKKKYEWFWKYLCVPCWYVYDPEVGDPDSGIAPWTAFEDIPDTWKCPVCGVTKKDFIPLWESKKIPYIPVEIVQHAFINRDANVLLLKIKTQQSLTVHPWQYVSFVFSDENGEFRRSYSIVKVKWNIYTFLIRIQKPSRWGSILESKNVWDTLNIAWVFWDFALQPTEKRKVFIGTGTGLAPLFHMLLSSTRKDNILLFGSKNLNDTFYLEELANLESVKQVYVYLSREENVPEPMGKIVFVQWRMDFDTFFKEHSEYADEHTEFYLCGNPHVVQDAEAYLQGKKYLNIFSEKF